MHTDKYQLVPEMVVLAVLLTLVLTSATLLLTWQWFTDWPPLSQHLAYIWRSIDSLVFGDDALVIQYREYLSREGLTDDLILHITLPLISSALLSFWISLKLLYIKGGRDPDMHVQGPNVYSGHGAVKHACAMLRQELKTPNGTRGVKLHPGVQLTVQRELGNLFVYGQQGSGKSVVIKPLIKQIIARGDRALLYDHKGEYTSLFFGEEVALINPTDRRSFAWNPSRDIFNEEQAALVAGCLVTETGQDEFWISGARLILTGCIVACIKRSAAWSWPELKAVMDQPDAKLHKTLEAAYPIAATLIQKDSKTSQGFRTILATQLSWLGALVKAWPQSSKHQFAISDWVRGKTTERLVIVPCDPLYSSVSGPLFNALISLATQHLLSLPDSHNRRVWFGLDELGNLPRCDSLSQLLSLGRSKGARTIAGAQSTSQLYSTYGQDQAETMLSLFANVVSLRLGIAGASAKKASETFGNRIVKRPSVTIDHKGHRSVAIHQLNTPLVHPEEIAHLPQASRAGIKGYLSVAGWQSVYLLFWPISTFAKVGPEHVPALWLRHTAERTSAGRCRRRGARGRARRC